MIDPREKKYQEMKVERDQKLRDELASDPYLASVIDYIDVSDLPTILRPTCNRIDPAYVMYDSDYAFTMRRVRDDIEMCGLPDAIDPAFEEDFLSMSLIELYEHLVLPFYPLLSNINLNSQWLWRWQEIASFFNCSEAVAREKFEKAKEFGGSLWISNTEFVSRHAVVYTTADDESFDF